MTKQKRWEFTVSGNFEINFEEIELELSMENPIAFVEHNSQLWVVIEESLVKKAENLNMMFYFSPYDLLSLVSKCSDNSLVYMSNFSSKSDNNGVKKAFINWAHDVKKAQWPNKGIVKVSLPRI